MGRWEPDFKQNSATCFRVRSRSTVTFKAKLSVTIVNNNFQLLSVFCNKELHLRRWIGLVLNIVTFIKLLKQEAPPMIQCNLGKIWKTHSPRYPENTSPEVFCIRLSFLHLLSNRVNEDCGFFIKFCEAYLVKAHNHLISSNQT